MNSIKQTLKFPLIFLCITLAVLFSSNVHSQSLLYEISGKGIKHPVYLYGTIHALPQSDFFMDDVVMEKFAACDKVVFEIDFTSANLQSELMKGMLMENNSLDKILSAEDYKFASEFFRDSVGIPLENMSRMKPFMATSMMLNLIMGDKIASYESWFLQQAMTMGKAVAGIETVAEQFYYVDKISLEQQAKMFMESIRDFSATRKTFFDLVALYKTRDVDQVFTMMHEASLQYKSFGEYLLDERNRNWISRIEKLGAEQSCFIAVGCGHLGGENGVLKLLEKQGFKVDMIEVK